MLSLIILTGLDSEDQISNFPLLFNGESLFDRHIRIMESYGVREFIIVCSDDLHVKITKRNHNKDTRINFIHSIKELSSWPDIPECIWVTQGNLVFTKETIHAMLKSDMPCLTLVRTDIKNADRVLRARLDMNHVLEIGILPQAVGCYSHFPLYKLDRTAFNRLIVEFKDLSLSLTEAINRILPEIRLGFLDCASKIYIDMISSTTFDYINNHLRLLEASSQQIYEGPSSIMHIPDILKENDLHKPFVVCDSTYSLLPVGDYFDCIGLSYTLFSVSDMPDKKEIARGVQSFNSEGCDIIISVGYSSTIEAAKAIKMFLMLDKDIDYLKQDLQYSPVKHIAMPVAAQTGSESTRFATIFDEDTSHILAHDCMLPDYAILDDNLNRNITFEKEQSDEKGISYKTKLRCLNKAIKRTFLENPADPTNMLAVANFMGRAINLAGDNITFNLGRALSEECGIPFNQAAALCLPFVWNYMRSKSLEYIKIKRNVLSTENPFECYAETTKDHNKAYNASIEAVISNMDTVRALINIKKKGNLKTLLVHINNFLNLIPPELSNALSIEHIIEKVTVPLTNGMISLETEDIRTIFEQILSMQKQSSPPEENLSNNDTECKKTIKTTKSKKKALKGFWWYLKSSIKKMLKLYQPVYKQTEIMVRRIKLAIYRLIYGVDYRTVLFESFAGREYRCNPKALYEQMLQDGAYSDFKFIWAFNKPSNFKFLKKNPNTKVIKRNSKAYIKACATSKYWITNYALPKYAVPSKEQVYIQTWHGKPLKRIGCDFKGDQLGRRTHHQIKKDYTRNGKRLSILLSPAPIFSEKMSSAYNLDKLGKKTIIKETGYPRNDFLFTYTPQDVLRIKMNLGIPLNKKVVLYAPTWRSKTYISLFEYVYHSAVDLKKLHMQLGNQYVILFRAHDHEAKSIDFSHLKDAVIDVTHVNDVNELYIVSDLMISDYSGTIFDYANLKRPMVLYMYDREDYEKSPGFYFDPDTFPAKIVYKEEDLAPAIIETLENFVYDENYKQFNETYNKLDGPDCSINTLDKIIDLKSSQTKSKSKVLKYKKFIRFMQIKTGAFFREKGFLLSANSRMLKSFKNKHKGQRCFLIGNGPSLTITDLNKLKNEICFGCNMIYKIFDRTEWRPTYYCLSDRIFVDKSKEIVQHVTSTCFFPQSVYNLMPIKPDKTIYLPNIMLEPYKVHGNPLGYYSPSFATVMSMMLELAMFMGFSEIYLLGVDCTNSHVGKGHFINNYRDEKVKMKEMRRARRVVDGQSMSFEEYGQWLVDRAQSVYKVIKDYAEEHGFHIYNATRGGDLRAFKRVDLDEVLSRKSNNM